MKSKTVKKILTLTMSAILVAGTLTGCGGSADSGSSAAADDGGSNDAAAADSGSSDAAAADTGSDDGGSDETVAA
ncbi:MAG: hypothetical protein J5842_02210, partial [Lachnospiraceae bacterium]|nr:hypothetical protein [Lachnospiraceae bacterium]